MPSIRYANQSAPFWDFVAGLENQGPAQSFAGPAGGAHDRSDDEGPRGWGPSPWMGPFMGFGGPRGWHHGPPGGHRGPPGGHYGPHNKRRSRSPPGENPPPFHPEGGPHPPPPHHGEHPPPPHHGEHPPPPPHMEGQPPFPHSEGPPPPPSGPHDGPGPIGPDGEHRSPRHGGHAHSNHHCGPRGRGGRSFGGHDRFGPRGPPPFPLGGIDFAGLAEMFQRQLFGEQGRESEKEEGAQDDFQPEADVFDTETSYVVHVSLPGAKKEDVGVSWDSEKSELNIAGVIYRPGDEDFLKTLALDERKVGAFQRKIRLGSRANPAQVDADAITAKLEDGVLRVEVGKLDKDYVEIKKVDIE